MLLGKKVGFSLDEIKEMLDLYDLKDGQTTQLEMALEKFERADRRAERQQKQDIEQAIDELTRTMAIVSGMLQRPRGRTPEPRCEAAE